MIIIFFLFYPDFNEDRLADIIHRGRDHGLPTYKQVREFCGLSPISTFQELNTTMDSRVILNLQHTYKVRIAETLMEYFLANARDDRSEKTRSKEYPFFPLWTIYHYCTYSAWQENTQRIRKTSHKKWPFCKSYKFHSHR